MRDRPSTSDRLIAAGGFAAIGMALALLPKSSRSGIGEAAEIGAIGAATGFSLGFALGSRDRWPSVPVFVEGFDDP